MSAQYDHPCNRCHGCTACNRGRCCGRCNCRPQCAGMLEGDFQEQVQTLRIQSGAGYSSVFPTWNARTVTVFVKNTGSGPVTAFLQNSPDGLDFVNDPRQIVLAAGEMGYLTPYIFSKHMRIVVTGAEADSARIWLQMQNNGYFQHPV